MWLLMRHSLPEEPGGCRRLFRSGRLLRQRTCPIHKGDSNLPCSGVAGRYGLVTRWPGRLRAAASLYPTKRHVCQISEAGISGAFCPLSFHVCGWTYLQNRSPFPSHRLFFEIHSSQLFFIPCLTWQSCVVGPCSILASIRYFETEDERRKQ